MKLMLLAGLLCSWIITSVYPKPLHHFMTSNDLEDLLGAKGLEDIPEYQIVTPLQIDHKGDYLSHDLTTPHTRARREEHHLVQDLPAHFEFTAFGERHQMTVKPNTALLAPSFFVQIYGDNGTVHTDFDVTLCHYVGNLTSHSAASHVAVSNCKGLMGVVMTANHHAYLRPLPEHLIKSEGNPDNHSHVVYKRAATASPNTGATPRPNFGQADCGVEGSVPQKIYKKNKRLREDLLLGHIHNEDLIDSEGSNLGGRYIVESLVVGDSDLYKKHGSSATQTKNYIITLMNIASSLYNKFNLGFDVRLILNRIQIFTTYNAQTRQRLYINQNSKTTLESFCKWQANTKPDDPSDPLDYDHGFLLIGRGMCYNRNEDCWELGRAWIQGMCSADYACSVNADKGLQLGYVFGHELGHNLGMLHDGANGRCRHEDGYLMKSTTSNAQNIFLFSSCSKDYLLGYLREGKTKCLRDIPGNWEAGFGRLNYKFPGTIHSRDQQCKYSFGKIATYCHKEPDYADHQICSKIWCDDKDYSVCVSTYTGAADGTPCDYQQNWRGDKVCYRRRCISKSQVLNPLLPAHGDFFGTTDPTPSVKKPTPTPGCVPDSRRRVVDGQWTRWSAFTPCGRSCGGGFRYRERFCTNPAPSNCGRDCAGESRDIEYCNYTPCPGVVDYRQEQCSIHNNLKPGIDLVPDYNVSKQDECRLRCVSISDVKYIVKAAEAADGTHCNQKTNDRCFFGKCHPVGCDNVYGSRKQFDRCGVCGGNGNSKDCRRHTGYYRLQHQWTGYYDVIEIPAKASRISITELTPSPSITLALSDSNGASIFNIPNVGSNSQTKTAAGSVFVYERPGSRAETITSAGPIDQPVTVKIYYDDQRGPNPGVVYGYDLPKSVKVKEPTYGRVSGRTTCSVTCGKGKITVDEKCARRFSGGYVANSKCLGMPPVSQQSEPCDAGSCSGQPSYYWVTTEWSKCSSTCSQSRSILCRNGLTNKNEDLGKCFSLTLPKTSQECVNPVCTTTFVGDWIIGQWSACSMTCGSGKQTRSVSVTSLPVKDQNQNLHAYVNLHLAPPSVPVIRI